MNLSPTEAMDKYISYISLRTHSKRLEFVVEPVEGDLFYSVSSREFNKYVSRNRINYAFFYVDSSVPSTVLDLMKVDQNTNVPVFIELNICLSVSSSLQSIRKVFSWLRNRRHVVLVDIMTRFDMKLSVERNKYQFEEVLKQAMTFLSAQTFVYNSIVELANNRRKYPKNKELAFEKLMLQSAIICCQSDLNVIGFELSLRTLSPFHEWKILTEIVNSMNLIRIMVVLKSKGMLGDLSVMENLGSGTKGVGNVEIQGANNSALRWNPTAIQTLVLICDAANIASVKYCHEYALQVHDTFDGLLAFLTNLSDDICMNITHIRLYKRDRDEKYMQFSVEQVKLILPKLREALETKLCNTFDLQFLTDYSQSKEGRRVEAILKEREASKIQFYIRNNRKGMYNRTKLMVLGSGAAGKSSLCRSLLGKPFIKEHLSTVVANCDGNASLDTNDINISKWTEMPEGQNTVALDFMSMAKTIKNDSVEGSFDVVERQMKYKAEASVVEVLGLDSSTALFQAGDVKGSSAVSLSKPKKNSFSFFGGGKGKQKAPLSKLFENIKSDGKRLSIYDFGGQKVFDVLHHMYLTNAGMLLLVLNLVDFVTNPDSATNELNRWLRSLCVYTNSVKVFIVGTRAGDPRVKGAKALNEIDEIIRDALLEHDMHSVPNGTLIFFPVENSLGKKNAKFLKPLKCAIATTLEEDKTLPCNQKIPLAWLYFIQLVQSSGNPVSSFLELVNRGVALGFQEQELKSLFDFFTKAGIILSFHDRFERSFRKAGMLDDIVLHPEWLLSTLGTFIFDFKLHKNNAFYGLLAKRKEFGKLVKTYKHNGLLACSLLAAALREQGLTRREVIFVRNVCELMLIMSKMETVPAVLGLTKKHIEKAHGFWLVPAMNTMTTTENSNFPVKGSLKWENIVPQGLFERFICSFITQEEDVEPVALYQGRALVETKGVQVEWVQENDRLYTISIDSRLDFIVAEVTEAIRRTAGDINSLGFALELSPVLSFGNQKQNMNVRDLIPSSEGQGNSKDFKWDCFLSHTWGPQRRTHEQVVRIAELLKAQGLRVWIDAEQMKDNIAKQMVQGMNGSACFIAFITKEYLESSEKVNSNAGRELHYAAKLGVQHMIPVLLDTEYANPDSWQYSAGLYFGAALYIDFTNEGNINDNLEALAERIREVKASRTIDK